MSEEKIREIADKADMIIKGYAFTRNDEGLIQVIYLADSASSMIITADGERVATNMDEIEQALVLDIWKKDSKYMERPALCVLSVQGLGILSLSPLFCPVEGMHVHVSERLMTPPFPEPGALRYAGKMEKLSFLCPFSCSK